MGEAVHERCKTGEYSITAAAAPCPTTVAAVVAISQRLMDYIRNRLLEDAKEN